METTDTWDGRGIEDTKKTHRGRKQTIGDKGYWAGTPRVQETLRIQGTQGKQGKLQTHERIGAQDGNREKGYTRKTKDARDTRDSRRIREIRNTRGSRETRDKKHSRDTKDIRDTRDAKYTMKLGTLGKQGTQGKLGKRGAQGTLG